MRAGQLYNKEDFSADYAKQGEKLKKILKTVNKQHPEWDTKFKKYVPVMHLYGFAIEYLQTYGYLSGTYAMEIEKYYMGQQFPAKIEKKLIRCNGTNILYALNKAGHKWSSEAVALIKHLHPVTYNHFFSSK